MAVWCSLRRDKEQDCDMYPFLQDMILSITSVAQMRNALHWNGHGEIRTKDHGIDCDLRFRYSWVDRKLQNAIRLYGEVNLPRVAQDGTQIGSWPIEICQYIIMFDPNLMDP